MNSGLFVVLLATAATAAVISNDMPDVKVLRDAADVDVNEGPGVLLGDVIERTEVIDAAEETAIDSRRDLSVGFISGSSRVYNAQYTSSGITGRVIVVDITVPTNGSITAIRVTRVGASQNATPSIVRGGVGSPSVVIRIRSAVGRGFNYRVEVYAR